MKKKFQKFSWHCLFNAGRCDQAVFLSAVGAGGGGGLGGAAGAAGASADGRQLASFPLIEVAVGSGRDMLWPKTKEGIKRCVI